MKIVKNEMASQHAVHSLEFETAGFPPISTFLYFYTLFEIFMSLGWLLLCGFQTVRTGFVRFIKTQ